MAGEKTQFKIGQGAAWTLIVAFCLVILAWGYFNYWLIPDAPREYDLGALPDAPGESIYSSKATPTVFTPTGFAPHELAAPRQVPPLPEARPPVPQALSETQPLRTWPITTQPATAPSATSTIPEGAR